MCKDITPRADFQADNMLFTLDPIKNKDVLVDFSAPDLSSLGGLTLVNEYIRHRSNNIIDRIVSSIRDTRNPDFVVHSMQSLVTQRVCQIAAGYEDADDCDRLRGDGILKMCCGRTPDDETDLASQPTMTRLENRLSKKELHDIALCFVDDFIASYDSEPDAIVIDADDTNSDTYGSQQLTLFNAYYGEYCYMPLLLFEGRSGRLILPILRPGRHNKSINIAGLLIRLIGMLRKHWKHTVIIFRGDSHFCSHQFMDWAVERQDGVHFITGLTRNDTLAGITKVWIDDAVKSYKEKGEDVKVFHSFMYKAESWKHSERVVVKIEVGSLGINVRYVVTDFRCSRSRYIYEDVYCDRGRMELMIAELKNGLNADRMSCHKFSANQFRLFLHCAAYVILHAFRKDLFAGTSLEDCTLGTIRNRIIICAVSIVEKKTRIKLQFSEKHPMMPEMVAVLQRLRHMPAA